MGLDFSHGGAHWSYSGFMAFRKRLAREIGVDLECMAGFAPPESLIDMSAKDWDLLGFGIKPERFNMSWNGVNDTLVPLLNHSDCDGSLSADECCTIAPRLREIVQRWTDDPEQDQGEAYDKRQALLLADGMEQCAREGRALEFR